MFFFFSAHNMNHILTLNINEETLLISSPLIFLCLQLFHDEYCIYLLCLCSHSIRNCIPKCTNKKKKNSSVAFPTLFMIRIKRNNIIFQCVRSINFFLYSHTLIFITDILKQRKMLLR